MVRAETETTKDNRRRLHRLEERQTGQTDETRRCVHTMTSKEAWEALTTQPQLPKDSNIK